MPRPLKVFGTHIGFHDLIVAAPSMKAAAQAWHASPRIFAQGFARRVNDPQAVRAALAAPGMVLSKPHGEDGPYTAHPALPKTPRLTARQKKALDKTASAARRHEAARKRAAAQAEREARKQAATELAAITAEESRLRARRQALQKKLHSAS